MPPVTASLTGSPPGVHRQVQLAVQPPFCAGDGLAPAPGAGAVRMGLDVAGVNHQPLEIRVIQHRFQQPGPLAPVPASGRSGDGCSSSPRSPGADRAKAPQSAVSNTPRSQTVDCPWPGDPFCLLLQATEAANVSKPGQKDRAFDALLSYPHLYHSYITHIHHSNLPSSPYLTTPLKRYFWLQRLFLSRQYHRHLP